MSFSWLISNLKTFSFDEICNTELASTRLRAGVCIKNALDNNHIVVKVNDIGDHIPDVLFISKYVHDSHTGLYIHDGGVRGSIWLNFIRKVKFHGGKVIVDYTDHHLITNSVVGSFYREILDYVDGYVVPSHKMKNNILPFVRKKIWIIPEPVEVEICEPKKMLTDSDRLNILWFGHNSNLPYLFKMIQGVLKDAPPYNLIILSNYLDQSQFTQIAAQGHKQATYNYGKWSLELMEKVGKKVDMCVIPGDTMNPKKNGVSPGRLLTSLAMGLPTIATSLDSYLPFAKYFIADTDVLSSFFSNPLSYREKILEAQGLIQNEYTVNAVGEKWLKVCEDVLSI